MPAWRNPALKQNLVRGELVDLSRTFVGQVAELVYA